MNTDLNEIVNWAFNGDEKTEYLIIKVIPTSPLSICRNKGTYYIFNAIPPKNMFSGMLQHVLNIMTDENQINDFKDNGSITKEQKKNIEIILKNNKNKYSKKELTYIPIIDLVYDIDGIKIPKNITISSNYISALSVDDSTKEFYPTPIYRQYGLCDESYYFKLKCTPFFKELLKSKITNFYPASLGTDDSTVDLMIMDDDIDIDFSEYNAESSFNTIGECILNYNSMNILEKYGFSYIIRNIFPDFLDENDNINVNLLNIQISSFYDRIKTLCESELQYSSFNVLNSDESNNRKYYGFKPISDNENSYINSNILIKYKSSQGNPETDFKNSILSHRLYYKIGDDKPIKINKNSRKQILKLNYPDKDEEWIENNLYSKDEEIKKIFDKYTIVLEQETIMDKLFNNTSKYFSNVPGYANPTCTKTRILGRKSNETIDNNLVIFSFVANICFGKLYDFDIDKNIKMNYCYLPNLDIKNMIKYQNRIMNQLVINSSSKLFSKIDKDRPILFYSNINKYIDSSNAHGLNKFIYNVININSQIGEIIHQSSLYNDDSFFESMSRVSWSVISRKNINTVRLNHDLQKILLSSNKIIKDFSKYKLRNGKKLDFSVLLPFIIDIIINPSLNNLYKLSLKVSNYNFEYPYININNKLINIILNKYTNMDKDLYEMSLELGKQLNLRSYFLAKDKVEKNNTKIKLYEERDKYISQFGDLVLNSKSLVDLLANINKFLKRFNGHSCIIDFFKYKELINSEKASKEFMNMKKVIFIFLTSKNEKDNNVISTDENFSDDGEEIELKINKNIDSVNFLNE